jgi:cation diffusion facilitator CzcD-associated flavoprotein CzcO
MSRQDIFDVIVVGGGSAGVAVLLRPRGVARGLRWSNKRDALAAPRPFATF